jgi:hypothetical protein
MFPCLPKTRGKGGGEAPPPCPVGFGEAGGRLDPKKDAMSGPTLSNTRFGTFGRRARHASCGLPSPKTGSEAALATRSQHVLRKERCVKGIAQYVRISGVTPTSGCRVALRPDSNGESFKLCPISLLRKRPFYPHRGARAKRPRGFWGLGGKGARPNSIKPARPRQGRLHGGGQTEVQLERLLGDKAPQSGGHPVSRNSASPTEAAGSQSGKLQNRPSGRPADRPEDRF